MEPYGCLAASGAETQTQIATNARCRMCVQKWIFKPACLEKIESCAK